MTDAEVFAIPFVGAVFGYLVGLMVVVFRNKEDGR
jgi:hypothetical protein